MKSHWRRDHAGFSMVELLVTIVIAGIGFAAMVPLFVQAQKNTSADNMRNVTLQVAQEKIETIRLLDYDDVTQAKLDDESFDNGQFGNSYTYTGGSGTSRTLSVAYTVAFVPETQDDGTATVEGEEDYKQVSVAVSWSGPPKPVRAGSLTTSVYRQYAGASIATFEVGPSTIYDPSAAVSTIVTGPVVIDVYVAPDDIESMNADAGDPDDPLVRRKMGYVQFVISHQNGAEYLNEPVYVPVSGEPGHYRYSWDNSTASDGVYTFQAIAVSGTQDAGPPASVAISLASVRPPAVTGLSAFAGDETVYLSWDTVPIGDFDHYEVYRSDDGGSTYALLADDVLATSYTDTGLTNGTPYSYYVIAVDSEAPSNSGDPCEPVTDTPNASADTAPPTTPTGFTALAVTDSPTVGLSWTASTDAKSGVKGYTIERSADGGATWVQLESTYALTSYTDTGAGWGATLRYRVRAVDNAGNASAYALAGPVTTSPLPMRTLTVTNTKGIHLYVWVQSATTGLWYTPAGLSSATKPSPGIKVNKNGGSKTWVNLPAGTYNVSNDGGFPTQAVNLTYGNGSVTL